MQLTAVYIQVPEGYIAFVEELPGANTQGDTLEEARENLREAVTMVLEANRELAEKSLAGLFELEKSEAQKLNVYEVQDEVYRRDLARIQKLYEAIIGRLQQVDLIKDFGGYDARTITPPDAMPRAPVPI